MRFRVSAAVFLAFLVTVFCLPGCEYSLGELPGVSLLPIVQTFEASPSAIKVGNYSTLSWAVTGASKVYIDNNIGNVALRGNINVSPSVTTYYTLTASNSSGNSTARTQIMVSSPEQPQLKPPLIISFYSDKSYVNPGEAVTLYWNTSGLGVVSIEPGGTVSTQGSKTVYPAVDTVYILTASNEAGSVAATVSIKVQGSTNPGNPVINFTAQHLGGTSWQLNWNVINATQIVIEPDIGQVQPTGSTVVMVPSGQMKLYKLTATNTWGWSYWQVVVASP